MYRRSDLQHYKARFFEKFINLQEKDNEETVDSTYKSEHRINTTKGIEITQTNFMVRSSVFNNQCSYKSDYQWTSIFQSPYYPGKNNQIIELLKLSNKIPSKIYVWIAPTRQKMNVKLFNIKRAELKGHKQLIKMLGNPQRNPQKNQRSIQITGSYLLSRQDIIYCPIVQNISNSILNYTIETPITAFSLINAFCISEAFIGLATGNGQLIQQKLIKICEQVYKNCVSSTFIIRNQIILEHFILRWLQTFWLCITDHHNLLQQKILIYLLINKISLEAVAKICEAIIIGVSRIINQGVKDKIIYTLNNPKVFLDEQIFIKYLFNSRE